jgi:MraZ protein
VALFLSRFDNKVDRKGRVSVPAPFRAALSQQAFQGVVVYPSPVHPALEGCGRDRIEQIAASIDSFNPYSEEGGALAAAILTRSAELAFDGEGRIVLPEPLMQFAGLSEFATFAGRGAVFHIWSPQAYAAYEREALERAREQAPQLALRRNGQGAAP